MILLEIIVRTTVHCSFWNTRIISHISDRKDETLIHGHGLFSLKMLKLTRKLKFVVINNIVRTQENKTKLKKAQDTRCPSHNVFFLFKTFTKYKFSLLLQNQLIFRFLYHIASCNGWWIYFYHPAVVFFFRTIKGIEIKGH